MIKQDKIFIGCLIAAVLAAGAHMVWRAPPKQFKPLPQAGAAFEASALRQRMAAAGIDYFSLFCDKGTQRVGAEFTFRSGQTPANLPVVGDTPCQRPGVLVIGEVWDSPAPALRGLSNYDPDLVMAELGQLYSRITNVTDPAGEFDLALSAQLHAKYGVMAFKQGLDRLNFECELSGEAFRFVATFQAEGQGLASGRVATKCEVGGQAFQIAMHSPRKGIPEDTGETQLRRLEPVPPKLVEAAYRDFLQATRYEAAF